MKKFTFFLFFTFLLSHLFAQNLAGVYTITGQSGTITLNLENTPGNKLQGTLTDLQGLVYRAQADVKNGEAFGTLTTKQGEMYFEAFRKGAELHLTLTPAGVDNQPDPSGAQQFILTAGSSLTKNPVSRTPPDKANGGQIDSSMASALSDQQAPNKGTWSGTYTGSIMSTATTMTLQRKEDQLSGPVNAGGNRYQIEGTVSGDQSEGKLIDPRTEGYLSYTAELSGNQLSMIIQNPSSGKSQKVLFSRNEAVNTEASNTNEKEQEAGSQ